MPKPILKFEERVLREVPVGSSLLTIGRLPDNQIVIDNPAVSGHHARLLLQGDQYVLEDLQSLNGTFISDQRITQQALRDGDVVQVGKHRLVFQHTGKEEAVPEAAPARIPTGTVPDLGGTVFLDTKAQKDLMAKLAAQAQAEKAAATPAKPAEAPKPAPPPPAPAAPAPPAPAPRPPAAPAPAPAPAAKGAVLTVLSGGTDRPEYSLEAQTTLIGKSKTAGIQLKGWFKPEVAAAITRKGAGYVFTPLEGKAEVNHQPVTKPHELHDGDLIQVSGVSLQFRMKT
jgi:pSer/pThr/pTyr-binding forkhead associated (FHA) protein